MHAAGGGLHDPAERVCVCIRIAFRIQVSLVYYAVFFRPHFESPIRCSLSLSLSLSLKTHSPLLLFFYGRVAAITG